jgi:SAM-dependent methyltransferase
MTAFEFWEDKHRLYGDKAWISQPSYFAEEVAPLLTDACDLLDLGCGHGQDSIYFARLGHVVTALDFSPFALAQFSATASELGITQLRGDLSQLPYPFAAASFDVVYSHLALHYFSTSVTTAMFVEIARITRPGGRLLAVLNSVRDPECGTGRRLEDQFYELEPGDQKRFFNTEEVGPLIGSEFRVDDVAYVEGTRKKSEDQVVTLMATRL